VPQGSVDELPVGGGELRQDGQVGGQQVEGLFAERPPFRRRDTRRSLLRKSRAGFGDGRNKTPYAA
jgi:hypothetical protein